MAVIFTGISQMVPPKHRKRWRNRVSILAVAILPSLAAWDEALGASKTISRSNRAREDSRSAQRKATRHRTTHATNHRHIPSRLIARNTPCMATSDGSPLRQPAASRANETSFSPRRPRRDLSRLRPRFPRSPTRSPGPGPRAGHRRSWLAPSPISRSKPSRRDAMCRSRC